MRYKGDKNNFEELIEFATNARGSFTESTYTPELHTFLLLKTKTWTLDKKQNQREYWLDKDSENTLWRIILK